MDDHPVVKETLAVTITIRTQYNIYLHNGEKQSIVCSWQATWPSRLLYLLDLGGSQKCIWER